MNPTNETRRVGPVTRILFKIAGADEATMRLCGDRDWDHVRAISVLLIATTAYQTVVLSIVAHKILAPDGNMHIALILGAAGIALLIALIDSYVFLRAGFYAEGISELARGGVQLGGGKVAKAKAGFFLAIRILFSLGVAQLTALGSGLALCSSDISAEFARQYQQQNAVLISEAKRQVDGQIQRAVDEVRSEEAQVASTAQQLAAMRQEAVASGEDASTQSAQDELNQLLAEKTRRDNELAAAQKFAADEWSGIKSDPGNSGHPGRGPVRLAAEERVRVVTANVAATDKALAEARARLESGRKQAEEAGRDRNHLSGTQASQLEKELEGQKAQLAASRADLRTLIANRETNIRAAVDAAPDRADRAQGVLAQLKALRTIAKDPEIAAVILLIDFVSFSLEAAAVFAKVTSLIPSTYSALIAREAFMKTVRIVDGMMAELDRGPDPQAVDPKWHAAVQAVDQTRRAPPSGPPATNGVQPPKRPRGRPRKPRPSEGM